MGKLSIINDGPTTNTGCIQKEKRLFAFVFRVKQSTFLENLFFVYQSLVSNDQIKTIEYIITVY